MMRKRASFDRAEQRLHQALTITAVVMLVGFVLVVFGGFIAPDAR
jgi:hypothetical protein